MPRSIAIRERRVARALAAGLLLACVGVAALAAPDAYANKVFGRIILDVPAQTGPRWYGGNSGGLFGGGDSTWLCGQYYAPPYARETLPPDIGPTKHGSDDERYCISSDGYDATEFKFTYRLGDKDEPKRYTAVIYASNRYVVVGKDDEHLDYYCRIVVTGGETAADPIDQLESPYSCTVQGGKITHEDRHRTVNLTFRVSEKPTKVVTDPDEQRDVLERICGEKLEEGRCRFLPRTLLPDLSAPAVPVSSRVVNCESTTDSMKLAWSWSQGWSTSVGASVKAGGKIKGLVEVSVEARFQQTWSGGRSRSAEITTSIGPRRWGQLFLEYTYDEITGDFKLSDRDHVYLLKNVRYTVPPYRVTSGVDLDSFPDSDLRFSHRGGPVGAELCGSDASASVGAAGLAPAAAGSARSRESCVPGPGAAPCVRRPIAALVDADWCRTGPFSAGTCPAPSLRGDLGVTWPARWATRRGEEFVHWDAVVEGPGAVPRTASCPPGSEPLQGAVGARHANIGAAGFEVMATARGWAYTVPAGAGKFQFWGTCVTTGPPREALRGGSVGASAAAAGARRMVYASLPLGGRSGTEYRDIAAGIRRAFMKHRDRTGVGLRLLSDADPRTGRFSPARARANARRAARDPRTVAYVGAADSGAAAASIPVLNRAGILQVSPSATAVSLTTDARYRPSGRRTFARVTPSDLHQAHALASSMRIDGIRRVYVVHDGELYGRDLARFVRRAAPRYGIRVVGSARLGARGAPRARRIARGPARAVLYAGRSERHALALLRALAAAGRDGMLYGGDGLADNPRFLRAASRAGLQGRLRLTSPALDADTLPASGRRVYRDIWSWVGHSPDPYALHGYEAMDAVLDAIHRARLGRRGSAGARAATRRAFFATRDRRSPLGTYSIARNGDTTLRRYSDYVVIDGALRSTLCLGC